MCPLATPASPPRVIALSKSHYDGALVDGWLEAYRRAVDGTWVGYVRYTTAPAEQRIGWFTEDQLRRVE